MFFTIVDLGKSKHSESFGPPFQRQNFFPRRALGVLWGPPRGPVGVVPMSTPSEDKIFFRVGPWGYFGAP